MMQLAAILGQHVPVGAQQCHRRVSSALQPLRIQDLISMQNKWSQDMYSLFSNNHKKTPRNKGKRVGQKPPLKLREIWAIRIRLQIEKRHRALALFNLAIDSKLRACDLLKLRVSDLSQGSRIASRAAVIQQKTQRSVQFEITEQTRNAVADWIKFANLGSPTISSRVG